MKKIILTLLIAMLLLVGCGNKNPFTTITRDSTDKDVKGAFGEPNVTTKSMYFYNDYEIGKYKGQLVFEFDDGYVHDIEWSYIEKGYNGSDEAVDYFVKEYLSDFGKYDNKRKNTYTYYIWNTDDGELKFEDGLADRIYIRYEFN